MLGQCIICGPWKDAQHVDSIVSWHRRPEDFRVCVRNDGETWIWRNSLPDLPVHQATVPVPVPVTWWTGVVVAIFKKGEGCTPVIAVSQCSASLRKPMPYMSYSRESSLGTSESHLCFFQSLVLLQQAMTFSIHCDVWCVASTMRVITSKSEESKRHDDYYYLLLL